MRFRRAAAVAVAAVIVTMASSIVPGTRVEVQGWDCPPAPELCAQTVVAAGFPIPYIADYYGISPVGRVSLVEALMGIDKFRARAFWTDVGFYALMLATLVALTRRLSRREPSAA
jgi:hypothetical protein